MGARDIISRSMRLILLLAPLAAGAISQHRAEASSEVLLSRIISLLDGGDRAGAEALVRENSRLLAGELERILEEIDRSFDELGRQKARSDILEGKFAELDSLLTRHERIFELYGKAVGQQRYAKRFLARRLRIEGAKHTNRADLFWDNQDYDRAMREYAEAIKRLREAIPLARATGDQRLVASCLNNIGYAEIYSGNHARGVRMYSEALKIAERRRDDVYRGLYLLNLGTAYLYIGQPEKSLRYSLLAAEANRRSGRKTWEANALLNIGSTYLAMGQVGYAREYLQMALRKAGEAGDRRSHGRALYNLAIVSARLGQRLEAARLMEEALDWYRRNEEVYSRVEHGAILYQGLLFLADAYKKLNDPERAERYTGQAGELVSKDPQKYTAYLADPHLNLYRNRREAKVK